MTSQQREVVMLLRSGEYNQQQIASITGYERSYISKIAKRMYRGHHWVSPVVLPECSPQTASALTILFCCNNPLSATDLSLFRKAVIDLARNRATQEQKVIVEESRRIYKEICDTYDGPNVTQ